MAGMPRERIYLSHDRRLDTAVTIQKDKARAYHLPLKKKLLQRIEKYHKGSVPPFRDLRECSEPVAFGTYFDDAWKAIERGSMKKLKDSIRLMKKTDSLSENCLDVCYLQTILSQVSEKVVVYYVTLLAHAAVHQRLEMVKFLIKEGASLRTDNVLTGTPLTQLLVYTMLHGCHDIISCEIIEPLVPRSPAALNSTVFYDIPVNETNLSGEETSFWVASPLSFAILLQKFDVAALLTEKGANPLLDLGDGTLTCMVEYLHFGTNKFFSWLFQEHLLTDKIAEFVEQLLPELTDIFSVECIQMFSEYYKHPAHALLTCGNEKVVTTVLENQKYSLLSEKDPNGKTALQIAAGQGDVVSVKLLLKMSRRADDVDMNMKEAILAAAQNDHTEIVSCILQRDFSLGTEIVELITSKQHCAELSLLSSIFEAFRDYQQELLLHKLDEKDTTIAHVAAKSGNIKLFKVTFPLKSLSTMMFAALRKKTTDGDTPIHLAIENGCLNILKTLKAFRKDRRHKQGAEQKKEEKEWKELWEGLGRDLLLHASSNGSTEALQIIFDIVQDCDLHCDRVWKEALWNEALSKAAKTGKRDMVKYLLSSENISVNLSTEGVSEALLLAASNGNTRCVELLLQSKKEVNVQLMCSDDGCNCLMKAIEGNHRETVLTIVSDKKYGFKSLQVCRHTKAVHKDLTTPMRMLIVHMPDIAEWILNVCAIKDNADQSVAINAKDEADMESTKADTYEFIREKCYMKNQDCAKRPLIIENENIEESNIYEAVESAPVAEQSTAKAKRQQSIISTAPETIKKDDKKCCTSSNHPLMLMVDHDRGALLRHPLVKKYIKYKWFTVGIPGLIFYFALYLVFLIFLTTFALLIPRPSVANSFCAARTMNLTRNVTQMEVKDQDCAMSLGIGSGFGDMNDADNSTLCAMNITLSDGSTDNTTSEIEILTIQGGCAETLGKDIIYALRSISVILMVFSVIYLILEFLQFCHRRKRYLKEFENYIQVLMYSLTIIFVHWPHVLEECWCFPSWRWQIGAIALFLAWFNCCFLLKDWPWVGQPVTMLINVYLNFFTLVYLPILLILTFGFPLYMIHAEEGQDVTFANPARALWNIILQTTGELDNTVQADTNFVYPELTFTLLILFIIAMPVLFNNFLIGMAVGETEEERKKASLTLIKTKVEYTFEVQSTLKFLRLKKFCPCCHKLWQKAVRACMKSSFDRDQLEKNNKGVIAQMKSKFSAEDNQVELTALQKEMKSLKSFMSDLDKQSTATSSV